MTPDWSQFARALTLAVEWAAQNEPDVCDVGSLDQRMAAVRDAFDKYGVELRDDEQLYLVVAGVMFAWDCQLTLLRRQGVPESLIPSTCGPAVVALEALARFAPDGVVTRG